MRSRSVTGRRAIDAGVKLLSTLAAFVALFGLGWILLVVIDRGFAALNAQFFTQLPTPPGIAGGGLGNAILGTIIMTLLATVVGVPVGLLAGVFLSEFGKESRLATSVRFLANVLMGTPSIIIGVFVYTILVLPRGEFSGYAGAASLAVIMLPVVTRTAEDMLGLVPNALRESALALGAPRWRVTLGVVFRSARDGLITGALLAIARVSGETAPLLFTALNSPYWPQSLSGPMPNLTVTVFNYAMSPFADWKAMAWGASMLIMGGVLILAVVSRLIIRPRRM